MTLPAVVREIRLHGPDTVEVILERPDWLTFVPGDCVALFADNGRVSRPYSIASGTGEDTVGFLVRRMPEGEVSPYLASRSPGDTVMMSPPFGWFRPGASGSDRACVLVATGTGIAPFRSWLRSAPEARPSALYYGVRRGHDLVDAEELTARAGARLAVSREDWPGAHRGRVTDLLQETKPDPDSEYYLCGLDVMIDEVTDWLQAGGVPITRIHRECFFNAAPGEPGLTEP